MNRFMPSGSAWYAGQACCAYYTQIMPPNSWGCEYDRNYQPNGASTASSRHSRGVNVLFRGGSVNFVASTISPPT
jgi:prepilin-type processing-associated H-X9-DG protein